MLKIGLNFLADFVKDSKDWCWETVTDVLNGMTILCPNGGHEKERSRIFKTAKGKKEYICLSQIIKIVRNNKYEENLKTWFNEPI